MKKMINLLFGLMAAFVMAGVSPVLAQTAATPAPTPAAPTVAIDGMVDAYYSYNFTNAANHKSGAGNIGTYFDNTDASYSLGLAELKATATQGLASGHLVLAYGQEANLGIGGNLATSTGIDVEQAYVSYAPGAFTISGGRFVTWMGNEVIESTGNWNISRSLLFWYTIPLWHDGVSVAYAPDSTFKVTGYATNGWNNSVNTNATDALEETYGLSIAETPNSIWGFVLNGIYGPSGQAFSAGVGTNKYVGEAILDFNATSDLTFALDAEAGGQSGVNATFWGVDLYGKYAIASDLSAALRLEEVCDDENTLALYGNAFGAGTYEGRDVTLTLAHNLTSSFVVSLEGRYDYALGNGKVLNSSATTGNGPFSTNSADQLTTTLDTSIVF